MDYDLIVVKTLERVYKNYYYIIRGVIWTIWDMFYVNLKVVSKMRKSRVGAVKNIFFREAKIWQFQN